MIDFDKTFQKQRLQFALKSRETGSLQDYGW